MERRLRDRVHRPLLLPLEVGIGAGGHVAIPRGNGLGQVPERHTLELVAGLDLRGDCAAIGLNSAAAPSPAAPVLTKSRLPSPLPRLRR
jgi:hypothetical protein